MQNNIYIDQLIALFIFILFYYLLCFFCFVFLRTKNKKWIKNPLEKVDSYFTQQKQNNNR